MSAKGPTEEKGKAKLNPPNKEKKKEQPLTEELVIAAISQLDSLIAKARDNWQPGMNLVKARRELLEPTVLIYRGWEKYGVNHFIMSKPVRAWFRFLVSNEHYVKDEEAKLDLGIFRRPEFSSGPQSLTVDVHPAHPKAEATEQISVAKPLPQLERMQEKPAGGEEARMEQEIRKATEKLGEPGRASEGIEGEGIQGDGDGSADAEGEWEDYDTDAVFEDRISLAKQWEDSEAGHAAMEIEDNYAMQEIEFVAKGMKPGVGSNPGPPKRESEAEIVLKRKGDQDDEDAEGEQNGGKRAVQTPLKKSMKRRRVHITPPKPNASDNQPTEPQIERINLVEHIGKKGRRTRPNPDTVGNKALDHNENGQQEEAPPGEGATGAGLSEGGRLVGAEEKAIPAPQGEDVGGAGPNMGEPVVGEDGERVPIAEVIQGRPTSQNLRSML
ncbi:hypothetical protein NMY22_g2277 [Coprinellus aureogranulatus]|nr:hypothetical protein NMY22_g2277 [Coprinellus aureogranulatus]